MIQATSAPNQGNDLSFLAQGLEGFWGFFFDLIYGKTSYLFEYLQNKGIPVLDGLSMLIEQALLAEDLVG